MIAAMGATQKTLESIHYGIFSESITTGCLIFRLNAKVVGLMYILSTRPNILLRDYSQLTLTRPAIRKIGEMFE